MNCSHPLYYKREPFPRKFIITPSERGDCYSIDNTSPEEKMKPISATIYDGEKSIYDFIRIDGENNLLDSIISCDEERRQREIEKPSFANSAACSVMTSKKNSCRIIWQMTRPSNIPSIIILHVFGIHKVLACLQKSHLFRKTITHPSIVLTLLIIIIISATSMLINDYYDTKLGTDTSAFQKREPMERSDADAISVNIDPVLPKASKGFVMTKDDAEKLPLVSGLVTLPAIKTVLNYLYAVLLLLSTALPGIPTRITVVVSSMTTFYYTKFIKPLTWWKNVFCAAVMAMSPMTSGLAVFELYAPSSNAAFGSLISSIGRELGIFSASLFCALVGREMVMDILDYESDARAGIKTVPVKYGKKAATLCVLGFWTMAAILNILRPFRINTAKTYRSLLSWSSSIWFVVRGGQMSKMQGRDRKLMVQAVEEAKMVLIFMMLGACI